MAIYVYISMDWRDCRTPLAAAIQNRQIDALKLLLKHGANPNKTDGITNALQRAIICKYYDAIPLLLQYGGKMFGGKKHKGDVVCCIFMDYNIYIHFQDIIDINYEAYGTGENVLWYAVDYWKDPDRIKWLLDRGANPNPPTYKYTKTMLEQARDPKIRQLLIDYGAK
jgi:ankyrin repeat protein